MSYVSAILGALPNWCTTPGTTITAGSEAAGTSAGHLADADDLGAIWRSGGLSSMDDTTLAVDFGVARPVSSAYLVRHASRPGDTWRLRGSDAVIATPPRLAPTSMTVLAGTVDGEVTWVDDPVDSAGGDALSMSAGSTVRFTLGAAGGPLAGGEASQLVRLRLAAITASTFAPRSWRVALGAGGTPVTIGTGLRTERADYVVDVPFNSSLDPGGPLVVDVENVGPGPLALLAIEWRPETAADQVAADTGWSPLVLEPQLGLRYLDVGAIPEEMLRLTTGLHFIDDGLREPTHRHWRVDIRSAEHPRGYARAALLAMGPALTFDLGSAFDGPRVISGSRTLRMADGTAHTRIGAPRTEATLPVEARSLEGPRDFLALRRFVGEAGRFGVSLLPEEKAAPALSFFAQLTGDGGPRHQEGQWHDDTRGFWWQESLDVAEV